MEETERTCVLQERELLASCLKQNPSLPWKLLISAYNRAAVKCGAKERSPSSLEYMARAAHPSLQLIMCSRSLGLSSAASMSQLHTLVQNTTGDGYVDVLRLLKGHGNTVRRLCKIAEITVCEALAVLPGTIGTQAWVDMLHQQCDVEAEVEFWRGAFCKKFSLRFASMAQVRSQEICQEISVHTHVNGMRLAM